MRIIFMGTPDFAVPTLDALHQHPDYDVVGVVTATDKLVGRGKSTIRESAIKKYAIANDIPVLQPPRLKNPEFVSELRSFKADIQVVVAFRMLPVIVWDMPPLGTVNIHASLLPRYRGAAPINWAIIHGELKTGLSSFRLKHEIDTGDLIASKETSIGPNETAGDLHDRLMLMGGPLIIESLELLKQASFEMTPQDKRYVSAAPKIQSSDCEINWDLPRDLVHNFVRGMSPYPGAWTLWGKKRLKVLRTNNRTLPYFENEGESLFQMRNRLFHSTSSTPIEIVEVQLEGKKRMTSSEFLRGYSDRLQRVE